jgi:polyribonucleotide nucleotidyltransferase
VKHGNQQSIQTEKFAKLANSKLDEMRKIKNQTRVKFTAADTATLGRTVTSADSPAVTNRLERIAENYRVLDTLLTDVEKIIEARGYFDSMSPVKPR